MRISLPKSFFYTNKSQSSTAYVEKGILYISGAVSFEDLMYTLTYVIKGYNRCHYCGVALTEKTRSIDHMYPRRWGGISIPENLVPSCKKCNCEKRDMTQEQFMQYLKLKTQKKKNEYYQKCLEENLKVLKRAQFVLKREWLSVYDIREIIKIMKFNKLEKNKSKKLASYYRNWGQYPHPIVVSSDGCIFKGRHILHHAKGICRHSVMAIVLENVVVVNQDGT